MNVQDDQKLAGKKRENYCDVKFCTPCIIGIAIPICYLISNKYLVIGNRFYDDLTHFDGAYYNIIWYYIVIVYDSDLFADFVTVRLGFVTHKRPVYV